MDGVRVGGRWVKLTSRGPSGGREESMVVLCEGGYFPSKGRMVIACMSCDSRAGCSRFTVSEKSLGPIVRRRPSTTGLAWTSPPLTKGLLSILHH